jgi:periplasmic divalent cation tolerance protein
MISQHILVFCSCPDAGVAESLAQTLVRERLAACVNRISALRSTYEWEGKVQDEPEVLLLIKTTGARYEALELRIKALHPYEVPEIIAVPIVAGSGSYLAWLARGSGGERSPAPEVATER